MYFIGRIRLFIQTVWRRVLASYRHHLNSHPFPPRQRTR